MRSKAYEQAQSSERSTWDTLSMLSAADPGYGRALAQWHDAVQAMSLAMERMLARRPAAAAGAVGPTNPGASPASFSRSRRRTC
jgi:hypothetical protein